MVRNAIDFSDHTLRSLCITAPGAKEGSSTTVANLAWAWAEHGARVLVIDANFSRPSIHRLMGVQNGAGLLDHFAERHSLDELVQQTKIANVSVLTAGRSPATKSSASALTPQALNELLIWARSRADIILFDTAPLLLASDAAIIARQTDATVLVVRQQWSATRNVRRAVHLLSGGGEGLLGVVLTGAPVSASWDPLPVEDAEDEPASTAVNRAVVSRQRKRTRQAA
jgi:capsular exopolysaccharide synthesis family protein